jgi:hypothetical protein
VLIRDLLPAMHPLAGEGVNHARHQVMPATAPKSGEPHLPGENTLKNQVVDQLRLLRAQGTGVVGLEPPYEAAVCRPVMSEEDQPNKEAIFSTVPWPRGSLFAQALELHRPTWTSRPH